MLAAQLCAPAARGRPRAEASATRSASKRPMAHSPRRRSRLRARSGPSARLGETGPAGPSAAPRWRTRATDRHSRAAAVLPGALDVVGGEAAGKERPIVLGELRLVGAEPRSRVAHVVVRCRVEVVLGLFARCPTGLLAGLLRGKRPDLLPPRKRELVGVPIVLALLVAHERGAQQQPPAEQEHVARAPAHVVGKDDERERAVDVSPRLLRVAGPHAEVLDVA